MRAVIYIIRGYVILYKYIYKYVVSTSKCSYDHIHMFQDSPTLPLCAHWPLVTLPIYCLLGVAPRNTNILHYIASVLFVPVF